MGTNHSVGADLTKVVDLFDGADDKQNFTAMVTINKIINNSGKTGFVDGFHLILN